MQPSRALDRISPVLALLVAMMLFGCVRQERDVEGEAESRLDASALLEPPEQAPGEPHPFHECPEGTCPRTQPAYLFSGEFHERVADLRIASCTVGLDLVWARRYRSRLPPSGQARLGQGWDHSYNIHLDVPADAERVGITIYDGNARPQTFRVDARGSWTAPRYHRSGGFDDEGRFVLTFADGGQWIFRSAEESARAEIRKLGRIVDRNGNVVELEYDPEDRLQRVLSAAGQSLELEYDEHDRIAAVVAKLDAASSRRVTYAYGGNGDLVRVTSPAIVDTVTHNDFVDGTSTSYTYADGKLLTIEDALGHVHLRNTYQSDRLVRQQWGDVGETISITYATVAPTSSNEFAVTQTLVHDRMGRVREHFFDAANQLVILREYTAKLRAGDPPYFETRTRYNADGHPNLVIHPRGNATVSMYEGDLDPNAPARMRGNLRERQRQELGCAGVEADGSSATGLAIRELYEYEPNRGNEHGEMNFVTRHTDARGHATLATHDSFGNRTSIVHPVANTREDMEYSAFGQLTRHVHPEDQHGHRREVIHTHANDGHLRETVVDPEGAALRTTREYDASCNEIRRVDPRGHDTLYVYNQHDQLIREWSPLETCSAACGGGSPTRASTDRIYDANMNVVRVDVQALDCNGATRANGVVSTAFEYDLLDELTTTRREIAAGAEIVTRFELDADHEVRVVRQGDNIETTSYDERGLVFREIQGEGSDASTTQHDYDLNGNEIALHVGLEGPTRTTTSTYDCADRRIAIVDPMGNRTEFDYDPSGNVVEQRRFGEIVDLPGAANNILMERTTHVYDPLNRVVKVNHDHFAPAEGTMIGDGESVTTFLHDGESRVILEQDDQGHTTTHDFDSAGRPLRTVDATGNTVELEHDANGNILSRTFMDVPSNAGAAQVGVWTNVYDAQNNRIESSDPIGSTQHHCYDSLGNLVESVDPRGNHTRHTYDAAGRLLETVYALTDDGTGAGTVVGHARISRTWDANDRVIAREDPNGNQTRYAYDSRNRLIRETFADGTTQDFEYDVHGNLIVHEDGNGTILVTHYDALDRPTEVALDPGPGVNGDTTFESFAYDGRSLLVRATDDDSDVVRTHDSLGGLSSETQTHAGIAHDVGYARDGAGNATTTWYPGGRRIDRSFDGQHRTSRITEDDSTLVEFEYLGPNVLRKTYVEVDTRSDYAYDLARRMIRSEHIEIGGAVIDRREYGFDEGGNRRSEADDPAGGSGLRVMRHDSLGRMVASEVSGSAATDRSVEYGFDGAGNRTTVSGEACSGAYAQTGSDARVNQYSQTPCEDWSRDAAGNLIESQATTTDGQDRRFEYDHRGRLVKVWAQPETPAARGETQHDPSLGLFDEGFVASAGSTPGTAALRLRALAENPGARGRAGFHHGLLDEVVLEFAYDALGRKIHSTTIDAGALEGERYVYDDWNVIEEYPDRSMVPSATYLYGDGLDDRLQRMHEGSWWYFDDELGSTLAVARRDDAELVVERYAYQDYGEPVFLTAPTSGNPYLFAGGRWLAEVGLYDMRTRHLDPSAGRFIRWDTLGIWGDEENLGNGYTYVGNMPDTHTDPMGESKKPVVENCHAGARDDIEAALDEAQRIGTLARDWFNHESDRKRKARKGDWNKQHNDGRLWWGKYQNTRFHRIKWNYRKIAQRCQKDVITFKCRSTGNKCGRGGIIAWTHSVWGGMIRLCRNDDGGYFLADGKRSMKTDIEGGVLLHEVSHNINAIGDKEIGGVAPWSSSEVQNLAKKNPHRASWNAKNYEVYARER